MFVRPCSMLAACCAVLLFTTAAHAQNGGSERESVAFGVKGGVSASNWSYSYRGEVTTFDFRTGVTAGGFVEIPITSRLTLQPEILWSMKGAISPDFGGLATRDLTYLDLPLLVRYSLAVTTRKRKVSPYVFGGPTVGLLLSATSWYRWGGSRTGQDVKSHMSSADFGMVIGGGVQIHRLSVECRYALGLTNILNSDSFPSLLEVSEKNRALAVMVGMRF